MKACLFCHRIFCDKHANDHSVHCAEVDAPHARCAIYIGDVNQ